MVDARCWMGRGSLRGCERIVVVASSCHVVSQVPWRLEATTTNKSVVRSETQRRCGMSGKKHKSGFEWVR